ncbi:acyl-CoA dehydrogenase [Lysinibacillus agricola]|uniref:Acyl-CoA dehydrogenase n=1 Tax=Lysinibacillus agricola TaxID=2590012 RepID=A0ABX7ARH3_9BACI|nr:MULTISPECIES: acyl-CoA dehydrogenase [Lysinibacillus]KOS61073.1 acyl-CoA dehydrogenase [Lysinibacillus sp. FJAT-14222]QQP12556.1 acyl-CoA dehydrogenase [Lysinibacillus agricola]
MNILQIKEHGLEIEQLGRLPKDVLELIYEHQLFKLFTTKELGGKDLDLLEGIKVFQQMSALDGNFGWLVTIGTGGNAFIPTLNQEICEKIYSPRNAVIAGSGYPTGTAVKMDGGYRVTGQWKYCSGADYATTFTMNCFIEHEGVRTDEIISCSVDRDQVEVLDDWRAMGLKATASHTIRVQNAWVPREATFQLGTMKNKYGSAVHSFPFGAFAEASFLSVCLGITEDFLEETSILVKQRNYDPSRAERMGAIQFILMQQQKHFRQLEEQFYAMLNEYWQKHKEGHEFTAEELQQFSRMSKDNADACVDIVNNLIRRLGMDAITETSPINRIWRNLYTAAQHVFLTPF